MNPIYASYQLGAPSANLYATSQTPTSGTALTLTGTPSTVARRVLLTFGNEASNRTLILTGTDRYGNTQSETLAVPSGAAGTVASQLDYLTVTSALPQGGGWTAAVTLGTNTVGSTPWFAREFMSLGSLGAVIWIPTGKTVNASMEITWDDVNVPINKPPYGTSVEPNSDYPPKPVGVTGLTSIAATAYAEVTVPHFYFRLTINSGTDPAILQVIETAEVNGGGY